ncbi:MULTISPECIES: hypothetical protein [unclassified Pseudoalteromonas]|uniref:hypothetical protein n=1 Tax=unclassified Pseudoalteromonas TaxID=194690 RepID=UPI000CF6AEFE|nr:MULTISPECIES: hypothetical protein [unclassified Pseudoalteromonas]
MEFIIFVALAAANPGLAIVLGLAWLCFLGFGKWDRKFSNKVRTVAIFIVTMLLLGNIMAIFIV